MDESEAVPLKNISNSINVREASARKLVARTEYDTRERNMKFSTGVKITEHIESVVNVYNENNNYPAASETTCKNHDKSLVFEEVTNSGTNSVHKEKCQEPGTLQNLEESKSNCGVKETCDVTVSNKPIIDNSLIPALLHTQSEISETSNESPGNLATTDVTLLDSSLKKDLPVSPESIRESCLVETPSRHIYKNPFFQKTMSVQKSVSEKINDIVENFDKGTVENSKNLAATGVNVPLLDTSLRKDLPDSPENSRESCLVETPHTSTHIYKNPFSKRILKNSVSNKINNNVENLDENMVENTAEEIASINPCEKTNDKCAQGNESKFETCLKIEVEGSSVKNSLSPLTKADGSEGIKRNFFSPPTKVDVGNEDDELQIVFEKVEDCSSNPPEEYLVPQTLNIKNNALKEEIKKTIILPKSNENVSKCEGKSVPEKKASQKPELKNNLPVDGSKKTQDRLPSVCFVSDDPCENDDNNNPEWLALKKLETDEERYKEVRKRWKNLTIPDPNKNLTFIQIKSSYKHPSAQGNVAARKVSHKRAFSYDPSTSNDDLPPAKRSRTRSCTTSYDLKIKDHWREMEEKEEGLLKKTERDVWELRSQYTRQVNRLCNSDLQFRNYREYSTRLSLLHNQERQAIDKVYRKYFQAKYELANEGQKKSEIFSAALKEVTAFHNFYSKLDDKVNTDCNFLTEPEYQDIDDTDRLYQKFSSFYSC